MMQLANSHYRHVKSIYDSYHSKAKPDNALDCAPFTLKVLSLLVSYERQIMCVQPVYICTVGTQQS